MTPKISDVLTAVERLQSMMMEELQVIRRGLYGDNQNETHGLIKGHIQLEQRVDKMERKQFRFFTIISVLFIVVEVVISIVK